MDYVKFFYRPLAARAARQALVGRNRAQRLPDRGRFTRADVVTLLKTACGDYAVRVVKLPPEPTVGSRMNVKLGAAIHTTVYARANATIDNDAINAISLIEALGEQWVRDEPWPLCLHHGLARDHLP